MIEEQCIYALLNIQVMTTHIVKEQTEFSIPDAIPTIPQSENSEVSTFPSLLKSKEECEELFEECVFLSIKCHED